MNLGLGLTSKMIRTLDIEGLKGKTRADILKIVKDTPKAWDYALHVASNFKISMNSAKLIVMGITHNIKKTGVEAAFSNLLDTCGKISKQDL